MRFLVPILLFFALSTTVQEQIKFFPPGALSGQERLDQFVLDWYTKQLKALEESSLWELSKTPRPHAYRFLWLRTFHHPIAIRLDIASDGTSRLTTKMTSGAGGYEPGKLIQNDVVSLTRVQTDSFLELIEKNSFWKLPSRDETRMGHDGAEWIVEGVKDGNYHVVTRWSPENGEVRAIGMALIRKFAKLRVAAEDIY